MSMQQSAMCAPCQSIKDSLALEAPHAELERVEFEQTGRQVEHYRCKTCSANWALDYERVAPWSLLRRQ